MSTKPILSRDKQKRYMRALRGLSVFLVALIGLLKVSLGTLINFPIAFLFGDVFIVFFIFLALLGFYLIFFKKPRRIKRYTAILLSSLLVLVVLSVIYAYILHGLNISQIEFSAHIDNVVALSKTNLSFNGINELKWFDFAGVIGEGILLLLAPYGPVLFFFILGVVVLGIFTTLFFPQLRKLHAVIKEYFRDLKKRRKVLKEAAIIHGEQVKINLTAVDVGSLQVTPVSDKEDPLLIKVKEEEIVSPVQKQIAPIQDFALPSLDIEEELKTAMPAPQILNEEKEDFTELQKAVFEKSVIEKLASPTRDLTSEIALPDETTDTHDSSLEITNEINNYNYQKEEISEEITGGPHKPFSKAIQNENGSFTFAKPEVEYKEESEPLIAPVEKEVKNRYQNYLQPSISLLEDAVDSGKGEENKIIAEKYADLINEFFEEYDIRAQVKEWTIGSSFTRFEINLAPGESSKKITPYLEDLSRKLEGASVRFEPIIIGKSTSGIEVGNVHRTIVSFKECMTEINRITNKKYVIPLGKDVGGKVRWASFAEFPHLIVAGSTGSGKSVFLHTLLSSLVMRHSPDELRLFLVDPKRVEMAQYHSLPHLLCPIVKEPSEARVGLERLVDEMEKRYQLFETTGVSKMSDYNDVIESFNGTKIPLIIAVLDEFSDLFESEKEVSTLILKLAQKSRAAGIHILIATQRPDVKVITGTIKANISSRVAFMTASAVDSVTILGQGGAESLLGFGDMLVDSLAVGRGFQRIQAPFIPVKEVLKITNYIRSHYTPDYYKEFMDLKAPVVSFTNGANAINDDLYVQVLAFCDGNETVSINKLQQAFGIGWPRAKSLYDTLIFNGIIEQPDDSNSAKGAVVIKNKR